MAGPGRRGPRVADLCRHAPASSVGHREGGSRGVSQAHGALDRALHAQAARRGRGDHVAHDEERHGDGASGDGQGAGRGDYQQAACCQQPDGAHCEIHASSSRVYSLVVDWWSM